MLGFRQVLSVNLLFWIWTYVCIATEYEFLENVL